MKNYYTLELIILIVTVILPVAHARKSVVLFDDTHGQMLGNADWSIKAAYSEFGEMLEEQGYSPKSLSDLNSKGVFTDRILKSVKVIVLPEPNTPYAASEVSTIERFVRKGGGLFMIGDHGGSDRDYDGYDSPMILNSIAGAMGIFFVGDTFSSAPLNGCSVSAHPVMEHISAIGAFAASTIDILDRTGKITGLAYPADIQRPFIVAGTYGKGRLVAIGDSSVFDDGVGIDPLKTRHESFHSVLFDHEQLALNTIAWLSRRASSALPKRLIGSVATEAQPANSAKNIVVDITHGNSTVEYFNQFKIELSLLGYQMYFSYTPFDSTPLNLFSICILANPYLEYSKSEQYAIRDWVKAGGYLILIGGSDGKTMTNHAGLNELLQTLNSGIRFNSDEVIDPTNNSEQTWGVLIRRFSPSVSIEGLKQIMTWGGCSLISSEGKPLFASDSIELLATGDDDTATNDADKKGNAVLYPSGVPIALIAAECIGKGEVLCIGSAHLTDFQYPAHALYPKPYAGIEHQTPAFNSWLIERRSKDRCHD